MESFKTKLAQFDPELIKFDQLNPRGESEETIINDGSFSILKGSIEKYGILEPIIIKELNRDRFVLVDGERRLRAAKLLKLKSVPAILIDKNMDGNVLAYHVHMLRKQWSKAAETKSIKRIIQEIENETPNLSESEIKKKIKEVTKATQTRINDLYVLIKYEDKYIDLVTEEKLDISYLIQGQNSFVNRIVNKYPEILTEFPEKKLRSIVAEKSVNKKVPGTRYWMDTFKAVFSFEKAKEQIKEILVEFLEDKNISAEETFKRFIKIRDHEAQKSSGVEAKTSSGGMKRTKFKETAEKNSNKNSNAGTQDKKPDSESRQKNSSENQLDYSPITLSKLQQTPIRDIRPRFEKISKTFSGEEKAYVTEAIHCLEMQCFKASILMIWSMGISRILSFISKDVNDFNTKSTEMRSNNTSFYKYHCQTFQINASNIDEIRRASKDIQLLCYITHKGFITESQFKKLKANYDTRNDCAHPTSINLSVNEAVSIFENVLDLLIINSTLK